MFTITQRVCCEIVYNCADAYPRLPTIYIRLRVKLYAYDLRTELTDSKGNSPLPISVVPPSPDFYSVRGRWQICTDTPGNGRCVLLAFVVLVRLG